MIPQMVALALLSVVVAFLLSASEAAIIRMSRVRAEELHDDGRSGSTSLLVVVGDSSAYLAVLAFLRVVAEAASAVLITIAVLDLVDSTTAGLFISIAVMALVSFVIVGVSPRTLGRQNYDTVALWAAPFAVGLRKVLGPVAHVLVALGNAVTPGKGYREGPFQSEAELRDLLDRAGESDVIEDDEREMIHSVFELGDTVVREVMVPRTDMVTISQDKTLRQAMSLFLRSGFSRIPVVGDGSDDTRGLLYLKDVVRRTYADADSASTLVGHAMRPMHFVPESKPVDDLLREMQQDQSHFAIVVDEYGGTAGLVTLEDLVEELVGDIRGEEEAMTAPIRPLEGGRWAVDGSVRIVDVNEALEIELPEGDYETIAGLFLERFGRVPRAGDSLQVGPARLEILGADARRIRTMAVSVARR